MHERNESILRRAIREARESQGLSIAELSRRAACSTANLSRYLAGKRHIRSDVLDRLLAALGLEITQHGERATDASDIPLVKLGPGGDFTREIRG